MFTVLTVFHQCLCHCLLSSLLSSTFQSTTFQCIWNCHYCTSYITTFLLVENDTITNLISSQATVLDQTIWLMYIKVVYRHRYASVNQGVMYKGCQKCRGTMCMYTALHSGVMYKRRPQATSCPKKVAWGARDPKFSLLATFHLGRLPTPSQPTYIHPHPPTRIS